MRTWQRATRLLKCGAAPDCWIAEHEAYCVLEGANWKKLRCATHAGEEVPRNIDAPAVREPSGFTSVGSLSAKVPVKPVLKFSRLKESQQPHDWKMDQAKDEV